MDKIISHSLAILNLEGMKDRCVETLSGGEKQRVAIARAIAKGSKVIVADEPTGSLDEITADIVLSTLKELSRDILVILITHDRESAQKFADSIILLEAGKITRCEVHTNADFCTQEFYPVRDKVDAITLFSLSNKIVFEKRKKFIFTVFFWTFSLVFMMLSLSLYFVNGNSVIGNAINENNISHIKLVKTQQLISGTDSPYFIPEDERSQFLDIEVGDYYNVGNSYPIENFRNELSPVPSDFTKAFFDDYLFRYIVVTDQVNSISVPDGGVVITDFTAQMLKDYGILDLGFDNSVVGHVLEIDGIDLTISSVLNTDFSYYFYTDCFSLSSDLSCDFETNTHFLSERQNEYVSIYVNPTTFNEISTSRISFSCYMNEHSVGINRGNQLESITPEGMIGVFPETDTEVVVSMVFLSIVLGEYVSEENISDFLGQDISLVLIANNHEYSANMEITGITYSVGSEVFINDIVFDQILAQLMIDNLEGYELGTVILGSISNLSTSFLDYLQDNDAFYYSSYTNELFFILDTIKSLTSVVFIISAVSLVVLVTLMFFFSNNLVIQNRRQLGILMSIGMSRSDITTLVAIQSLRMLLVSFLISIPLFYLLIFSMNSFLINQAGLLSSIISYSPLPIIISLLISIGSNIIAIIEPIVKFSKTELVNIIYNR